MDHSERSRKVCLLGMTLESGNMGVSALAFGTFRCIIERFSDAEITILDYHHVPAMYTVEIEGEIYKVRLVNMRCSKRFFQRNHIVRLLFFAFLSKIIPLKYMRQNIVERHPCLKTLAQSDVVASINGGDSFSDIYGLFLYCIGCLPMVLALLMRKNLVLLPQTYGPYKSGLSRMLARFILKRAACIYSRDKAGIHEVRTLIHEHQINSRIIHSYDVGFALDPREPATNNYKSSIHYKKKEDVLVGLNVSGFLYRGGYTRDNMFNLKVDYKELVSCIVHLIMSYSNTHLLFVPHCFHPPDHIHSDGFACEEIYESHKIKYQERLRVLRGDYNQSEIKYIIGRCDFFMGSRMHSCIAALSQMIPTVGIAYSRKFNGVFESIGMEEWVAEPCSSELRGIQQLIQNAYEKRDFIRKVLTRTIPEVKEKTLSLFDEIDQHLSKGYV